MTEDDSIGRKMMDNDDGEDMKGLEAEGALYHVEVLDPVVGHLHG